MNKVKVNARIHNRFDVFKENVKTGEKKQIAYAENIILNTMWDCLASTASYNYFTRIAVGRGTGELSAARTTLFDEITQKDVSGETYIFNEEERLWSLRQRIQFSEVQNNGEYFKEVGIVARTGSSTYALVTHALLRDMNGNVVSILKEDTDIVTVYATTYLMLDADGFDGGANVALVPDVAINTSVEKLPPFIRMLLGSARPSYIYSNMMWINASTPIYTSNNLSAVHYYYLNYSTASHAVDATKKIHTVTFGRIAAGSGNVAGGIYGGNMTNGIAFDFLRSSEWPGSFISGEQIGVGDGVTKDFKTAFGHLKSGAVVKVDGTPDATVTVDIDKPFDNDLCKVVRQLRYSNPEMFVGRGYTIGSSSSVSAGDYVIFENPYYAQYGISSMVINRADVYASDDLDTWEYVGANTNGTLAVAAGLQKKRYFKAVMNSAYNAPFRTFLSDDLDAATLKNVHFDSAPAEGEIITIDYTTRVVAKDANHVFDMAIEITLGEYVEEY